MVQDFVQAQDDNHNAFEAVKPKTGFRLTGVETTTQRMSTTIDSSVIRVVSTAAINYAVSESTTAAVTTSDAYLPANTVEYIRAEKGYDRFAFLGSSVVYITTMK
jgi:hypothetical protein